MLIGSCTRAVSTVWKISNKPTDSYIQNEIKDFSLDTFLDDCDFDKNLESMSFDDFIKRLA